MWRQKPLGIASGVVILILILLAIFADVLAPYPFDQLNLADRLQGPSARHLLGTDQLGRDLLSRLLFGARISLVVGLAATTLNVVVATLIGGTSGFVAGKLDLAVQRFVDAWMAFPGLLLLLTIMSIAGQGLPQIIVVLGIAPAAWAARAWSEARWWPPRRTIFFWPPGRWARRRDRSWCATSCPTSWRR